MFNININFCRWLDSNRGPLVLEAPALPTEPQPLPFPVSLFSYFNALHLFTISVPGSCLKPVNTLFLLHHLILPVCPRDKKIVKILRRFDCRFCSLKNLYNLFCWFLLWPLSLSQPLLLLQSSLQTFNRREKIFFLLGRTKIFFPRVVGGKHAFLPELEIFKNGKEERWVRSFEKFRCNEPKTKKHREHSTNGEGSLYIRLVTS